MFVKALNQITLALLAVAGYAHATTYANFCDDHACSYNCGISVSVDNPGCLAESGRNSIAFHDVNAQQVSLVFTPDDACSCQSYCANNILQGVGPTFVGPSCMDLNGYPGAGSYRFIGGSCDPNNNC